MFIVRPVALGDIAALETLAATGRDSVRTMPRARAAIAAAVERSLASFAAGIELPGEETYMFVLEAPDKSLAGCAAMSALAGSDGMFFAFRNDIIRQVSRDLHIRHSVHALSLCSDLTGHSQLSSFHLRNARLAGPEAALLSRARLLFAAGEPQRFSDRFFSSLSGVTDRAGNSPFWDALGRKFFQMELLDVERAIDGARNRSLIVELMPHYPVYVPLLPGAARAVMGQVHVDSELALEQLMREGFEPDEFIDIFDAGPILRAHRMTLRSFAASMPRRVAADAAPPDGGRHLPHLVATLGRQPFRAVLVQCAELGYAETVALPPAARAALGVVAGDAVLTVKL